jgi:hypothetical protein
MAFEVLAAAPLPPTPFQPLRQFRQLAQEKLPFGNPLPGVREQVQVEA